MLKLKMATAAEKSLNMKLWKKTMLLQRAAPLSRMAQWANNHTAATVDTHTNCVQHAAHLIRLSVNPFLKISCSPRSWTLGATWEACQPAPPIS